MQSLYLGWDYNLEYEDVMKKKLVIMTSLLLVSTCAKSSVNNNSSSFLSRSLSSEDLVGSTVESHSKLATLLGFS